MVIARALYRNPDILVLDEALAALGNEAESEVMKEIEALQANKKRMIVVHRPATVKKCDTIYDVKDKQIVVRSKKEIFGEE